MCGINVILNLSLNLSKERLENDITLMNNSLDHRGPDSSDFIITEDNFVVFGNTRLSITGDFEKGNQPLTINKNIITFNGEIYNFKELEKELFSNDSEYKNISNSDTEFVLKLYEKYKDKYFHKFEGMFAFIIWDNSTKELIFSRDYFGKKPLYFTKFKGNLFFSSEIKSLKKVITPDHFILNDKSIVEYLGFGYPVSDETIYKKIERLKKNTTAIVKLDGSYKERRIYTEDFFKNSEFNKDLFNFGDIFTKSVEKRVKNIDNFNLLFSGGIDSTLILIELLKLDKKIKCIHVLTEKDKKNNLKYINNLSKKMNLNLDIIDSKDINQIDFYERVIKNFSEPNSDISIIPTYQAYSKCENKVAINGDGGDELFIGYRRHTLSYFVNFLKILTNIPFNKLYDNKLFNSITNDHFNNIQNLSGHYISTKEKNLYINFDNLRSDLFSRAFDGYNQKNYFFNQLKFDLDSQLTNCLMIKSDICSMINSIEARSPFLDLDLFKFSQNNIKKIRNYKLLNKSFLRNELSKRIDNDIHLKPKKGFELNKTDFYRENKDKIYNFLNDNDSAIYTYINKKKVIKYLKEYKNMNSDFIWVIYSFMCWEKSS